MNVQLKLKPLHFVGAQCFAVTGLLALVILSKAFNAPVAENQPTLRNEPVKVRPSYDDPRIITDEQLESVLHRLRPRFGQVKPKVNFVDHALRFWGVEATFEDPECLSGEQMRQLMIDDSTFVVAWGAETKPLLIDSSHGVEIRMQQGAASASHVDHTLASLAEVGTSLDHPLTTRDRSTQVQALLNHAIGDFSLNQLEYEWTTLALALYAPNAKPWRSKEGQSIDFNVLAKRIMRQRFSQGVCYGNHRLYTLTILLRIDDDYDILTTESRDEILQHLTMATQTLVAHQSIEGFWDATWAQDGRIEEDESNEALLRSRILATGHALEWWAMAPQELHPPREVMVRAGQWLVREIEAMPRDSIDRNYTFLSHAGRALALWRGGFPVEVLKRIETQTENGV